MRVGGWHPGIGRSSKRLAVCWRPLSALFFVSPLAVAAPLELVIESTWKGQAIPRSEAWHQRSGGDSLAITRLAFLLSEPGLIDSSGQCIDLPQAYGLFTLDPSAAALTLTDVPDTPISGISFTVGLDDASNEADPSRWPPDHPLNPVRNTLHWSWQGGYIFLAVEGRWRAEDGQESGFSYHLGNAAHRMEVRLPVDVDLSQTGRLRLRFHLDRVLGDSTAVSIKEQTSTHGREGDALARRLKERVEDAFEIVALEPRNPAAVRAVKEPVSDVFVGTPHPFRMRAGFPMPRLPADYPLTRERVELGRRLFNDAALSRDHSISCASCHDATAAFADARAFSLGIDGQVGSRHSMPLMNVAWKTAFFWDGRASSLREQALMPIQDATEMHESLEGVEEKLAAHPAYPSLFKAAFGSRETTAERLGIAIEQFLITQTSMDSRFDQARLGTVELTEQEKRGFELFFTEYDPRQRQYGADCFHCHGGAFFTDHSFHNNGLKGGDDPGLEGTTGRAEDRYKFATPSLRNVALTAPYMHDGRFATLEAVVEHYTRGIQSGPTLDPNLAKHPGNGIPLSEGDQAALVAFLRTLSDPQFER